MITTHLGPWKSSDLGLTNSHKMVIFLSDIEKVNKCGKMADLGPPPGTCLEKEDICVHMRTFAYFSMGIFHNAGNVADG
jgi:hypothetical protein